MSVENRSLLVVKADSSLRTRFRGRGDILVKLCSSSSAFGDRKWQKGTNPTCLEWRKIEIDSYNPSRPCTGMPDFESLCCFLYAAFSMPLTLSFLGASQWTDGQAKQDNAEVMLGIGIDERWGSYR